MYSTDSGYPNQDACLRGRPGYAPTSIQSWAARKNQQAKHCWPTPICVQPYRSVHSGTSPPEPSLRRWLDCTRLAWRHCHQPQVDYAARAVTATSPSDVLCGRIILISRTPTDDEFGVVRHPVRLIPRRCSAHSTDCRPGRRAGRSSRRRDSARERVGRRARQPFDSARCSAPSMTCGARCVVRPARSP